MPDCPECGKQLPEKSLLTLCPRCLNKRYLRTMLEREREAWASDDARLTRVDLARAPGGLRHIALNVDPPLAYCGARCNEPLKKRDRFKPDMLPTDMVCTDCRRKFDHVHEAVRLTREAKGVPNGNA